MTARLVVDPSAAGIAVRFKRFVHFQMHGDCCLRFLFRSDVLGQLMPIVGRDWSHTGVAELFTKIKKSGYLILYLTARAIGQADATRDYLFGLTQKERDKLPGTLPVAF